MFINRADSSAWTRDRIAGRFHGWDPKANRDIEVTDTKVPSIVWGLLNRYRDKAFVKMVLEVFVNSLISSAFEFWSCPKLSTAAAVTHS